MDHHSGDVYAVSLIDQADGRSMSIANGWLKSTITKIEALLPTISGAISRCPPTPVDSHAGPKAKSACNGVHHSQPQRDAIAADTPRSKQPPPFRLRHARAEYIDNVDRCLQVEALRLAWLTYTQCCVLCLL